MSATDLLFGLLTIWLTGWLILVTARVVSDLTHHRPVTDPYRGNRNLAFYSLLTLAVFTHAYGTTAAAWMGAGVLAGSFVLGAVWATVDVIRGAP